MRPFFTLHRAHATLLALTLLISPWIAACQDKVQEPNRPRLVLLIVVDQLRTDFIQRWEHRLRPRGLRYLLREHVAFAHRKRFDDGPIGTWTLSQKMAGDRDVSHVALGMAAVRLGVGGRRGAVEGLMRLGVLAQAAGYGLGKLACG